MRRLQILKSCNSKFLPPMHRVRTFVSSPMPTSRDKWSQFTQNPSASIEQPEKTPYLAQSVPTRTWPASLVFKCLIAIILILVLLRQCVEYQKKQLLTTILRKFLHVQPNEVPPEDYVPRKELESLIRMHFTEWALGRILCIVSPPAFGKTTLLTKCVSDLKQNGQPALLIQADTDALRGLCESLGMTELQMWLYGRNFRSVKQILKEAAQIIWKSTGAEPMLVIDHCDVWLSTEDGRCLLTELLEFAKECLEVRGLKIAFTSDQSARNLLSGNARITQRIMYMYLYEFTEEEARKFLKKKGIVDPAEQDKIFEVTGYVPYFLAMYPNLDAVHRLMLQRVGRYVAERGSLNSLKEVCKHLLNAPGGILYVGEVQVLAEKLEDVDDMLQCHMIRCDNDFVSFHDDAIRNYLIRSGYAR